MSTPPPSACDGRKRPNVSDDCAGCSHAKRPRYNYYYVLASESSHSEDEGTESVDSIQDKETDYCKDTTDTDTKSEVSDMVEFEVISTSDNDGQLNPAVSSSGEDVLIPASAVAAPKVNESNKENWATAEEDNDEIDSANSLFRAQLFGCQICRMCKMQETVNGFMLCTHCYQIRKTAYPPRPRRTHKGKKPSNKPIDKTQMQPTPVTPVRPSTCTNVLTSQDLGLGTSSQQDSLPREPISNDCYFATHPTLESWTSAAGEMCIMCNEQPKNGIFVHSTGGHMCCCYPCAVKYWSKSKRCAWCNLKAKNVIKGFYG